MSNIGRHRIWKQLAAITALALVIRPLYASIPVVQTESSEYLLGHRTAAIKSFGGTDALGWTDSSSYEGGAYTASRVAATVARETAIAAATLGIGTAARGGSTAAQAAYKGILATQAATGGYQIGTGASQIAGGDYEAGTVNVVAGSLRVSGSIASAGAISQSQANWTYGDHKSAQKFHNQMQKRGWTPQQIDEAMTSGNRVPAPIQVNPRNTATRYVHPTTGRSVVVDNVTHEVLHVGGDGFRY
jgi:hypothetical protein